MGARGVGVGPRPEGQPVARRVRDTGTGGGQEGTGGDRRETSDPLALFRVLVPASALCSELIYRGQTKPSQAKPKTICNRAAAAAAAAPPRRSGGVTFLLFDAIARLALPGPGAVPTATQNRHHPIA